MQQASCLNTDPDIYEEFQKGNWVVNKTNIPFCAVGPDHALEQVNRSMKVAGGLIGITQKANARTKFFLIAPEMANLADQAYQMAGITKEVSTHHHELNKSFLKQQEDRIQLCIYLKN